MRTARKHLKVEAVREAAAETERAADLRMVSDAKAQIDALIGTSKGRARLTQRSLQRSERAYNTPTREALLGFSSTANMRRSRSPVQFIGEKSNSMRTVPAPVKSVTSASTDTE